MIGNKPTSHVVLDSTYRCPLKVVEAANTVIAFKQLLAGGLADKHEAHHIGSVSAKKDLGQCYVCSKDELVNSPWMQSPEKQGLFVVVTSNVEKPKSFLKMRLL